MDPLGKTAMVTGAGRRLGRAMALALAEAGADVIVHYGSSRRGAEETAEAVRELGRKSWTLEADLGDVREIESLFRAVDEGPGRLDVLINSAASFERRPIDEVTAQEWDRILAVNLRAPFFATQCAARAMRQAGEGVVINLVDLSGMTPWPGYSVHGVSKAGLIFLTRVAAREMGPEVRVNAIAPGPILPPPGEDPESEAWRRRGDHLPLGRTGDPDDICRAALYLVRASYVTGVVLPVDGGERLVDDGDH